MVSECLTWVDTNGSSPESQDQSQRLTQEPRERFIICPRGTRGMEGHILAPALPASWSAQDALSRAVLFLVLGTL